MSLLSNCTSGGCGAKLGPGELAKILAGLPRTVDKNLLVGYDSSDDAAVYRLDDERSIVCTVDFFPPMVDDALLFGQIAAANALSDVYAMGGDPLIALNLACFPQHADMSELELILRGGAEVIMESKALLAGGHTIYDHEPKYGLAVTGIVDTRHIIRNNSPRHGDRLILTKPLGTGIVMAAARVDMADSGAIEATHAAMRRLNRDASHAMRSFDVSACTDITGFGLLQHAREMAGMRATLAIEAGRLPLIPSALELAREYLTTAAGQRNRNFAKIAADICAVEGAMQEILFDPQTSGGLMIAVHRDDADALLALIRRDDPSARIIGQVEQRGEKQVRVY